MILFFLIRVKGEKLALSANQLILRLRKWLRLINEQEMDFSIHSLRRGGATFRTSVRHQRGHDKIIGGLGF